MEQELLPLEQSSCLLKEYSKLMLLVKELHVVSQIFVFSQGICMSENKMGNGTIPEIKWKSR